MRFCKNIIKDEAVYLDLEKEVSDTVKVQDSENMMLCDEGFKTRPGIRLLDESPLFEIAKSSEYSEFSLTDFFLSLDGKSAQLAVVIESDNASYIYYNVIAVFSDGESRSLGYIPFYRPASYSFLSPYSYVIYTGKPTVGGGIYFMTRLGTDKPSDDFLIYEISEDLKSWTELSKKDFYLPTVLIGGRGDRAAFAIASADIKLPSPNMLESMNLLTGSFACYYTSDGYSSKFTLPEFSGTPITIICKITTNTQKVYEWKMESDYAYIDEIDINGNRISAIYNRNKNQVYFINLDGSPYYPDYFGVENNICFTVTTDICEGVRAASVTKACCLQSDGNRGASSVTVFSGSCYSSGEILWINPENPLYFPSECNLSLSEQDDESNMLGLNDRVIFLTNKSAEAFKVTSSLPYNVKNVISGIEKADSVSYPKLTLKQITSLPERVNPQSVARSGNEIYFCSESGNFYSLNQSLSLTKYARKISLEPEFAAVFGECYLAVNQKDCSVFDFGRGKKSPVLNWKFPIKPVAATRFGAESLLIAKDKNDSVYIYSLESDRDLYCTDKNEVVTDKISSFLTLRIYKSNSLKRLYSITADLEIRENSLLEIFDGNKMIGRHLISEDKSLFKRPAFFEDISAKLSFEDAAVVSGLGIRFSKLSKHRR